MPVGKLLGRLKKIPVKKIAGQAGVIGASAAFPGFGEAYAKGKRAQAGVKGNGQTRGPKPIEMVSPHERVRNGGGNGGSGNGKNGNRRKKTFKFKDL